METTTIVSALTRTEAAQQIVARLKEHYTATYQEQDIVIGFDEDGDIDFDYQTANQKSVVIPYFATNNGFTFDLDNDPAETSYWEEEDREGYLADYIADELLNLEFDNLIEFA